MSKIVEALIVLAILMPLFVKWHRAGVERYAYYDRLAFWNSLSDEDKESADWYVES